MNTLARLVILTAASLAMLLLTACSSAPKPQPLIYPENPARSGDPVLEPEYLADELARTFPPVRILDLRNEGDYAASRVKGAQRVDLRSWSDAVKSKGGELDEAAWSTRIGALGIDSSTRVFIYDSGSMTPAASAWFILQHFSVGNLRIINGGFPQIKAAAPQLIEDAANSPTPGILAGPVIEPAAFNARVNRKARIAWASKDDVLAALNTSTAIFDARSADEYTGKDARDNKRSGHLPNAVNLAHTKLLDENKRLRPTPELRSMLEAAGFKLGDRIVAHCQGGGRSSLAAIAAIRAGFGPVSNYYMSFGEWAEDESCPIVAEETPAKPAQQ
jgi:thiosulfate/3-mercaptopyruvate sulfurtransferase